MWQNMFPTESLMLLFFPGTGLMLQRDLLNLVHVQTSALMLLHLH